MEPHNSIFAKIRGARFAPPIGAMPPPLLYMCYQVFVIILNYFRSYGSKRSETEMLLFTLAVGQKVTARRAKSNMQVLHNKEDEEMNKSRL